MVAALAQVKTIDGKKVLVRSPRLMNQERINLELLQAKYPELQGVRPYLRNQ